MSQWPSPLPKYPDPGGPDPPLRDEGSGIASPLALLTFFFINLVAAYAPAMCWVGFLPGTLNKGLIFLFSPVAGLLTGADSLYAGWVLLAAFFVGVFLLSVTGYQAKIARFAIPCCLFAFSLLQGCLIASFIAGIHALGHS